MSLVLREILFYVFALFSSAFIVYVVTLDPASEQSLGLMPMVMVLFNSFFIVAYGLGQKGFLKKYDHHYYAVFPIKRESLVFQELIRVLKSFRFIFLNVLVNTSVLLALTVHYGLSVLAAVYGIFCNIFLFLCMIFSLILISRRSTYEDLNRYIWYIIGINLCGIQIDLMLGENFLSRFNPTGGFIFAGGANTQVTDSLVLSGCWMLLNYAYLKLKFKYWL